MSPLATAGWVGLGVSVVYGLLCALFAWWAWRDGDKADSTLFVACGLLTAALCFVAVIAVQTA